jgi:plastocyanin
MVQRFVISLHLCVALAASVLMTSTGLRAQMSGGSHIGTPSTKIVTVVIREFKYDPETVTVHPGDIVEWRNDDTIPHTVTAEKSGEGSHFDSKTIATGATWRYIPQKRGTYTYTCTYHPNMKGTLIVQ